MAVSDESARAHKEDAPTIGNRVALNSRTAVFDGHNDVLSKLRGCRWRITG